MTKDPKGSFEPEDQEPELSSEEFEEGELQEESPKPYARPVCPHCGWRNTRLSHARTILDTMLLAISLRAFRCRSCGKRFRARYHEEESEDPS